MWAITRGNLNAKTHYRAATVGYEAELWQMADALRGSMDVAEYKCVVLGLIFLKCTDVFEERRDRLEAERAQGADLEDLDEYRSQSIFWIPPEARWSHLKAQVRQATHRPAGPAGMAGFVLANGSMSSSHFCQSAAFLKMDDED